MLAEIVEAKTSKPGKLGGVMKMAGGGQATDSHDVKLDYKLYAVGATQAPKVSGNAKASSGGFGIGSALRLASFAGQMYMGGMMGGGKGPGTRHDESDGRDVRHGRTRTTERQLLRSPCDGDELDVHGDVSGMGSMPGMPGHARNGRSLGGRHCADTVSEALGNGAKAAMEQLGKKK